MRPEAQDSTQKPLQYITPPWLQGYIDGEQKIQDKRDSESLKGYEQASADWVTNNVLKREREGANFTPTAPPPLPTKTTFFDAGGYMDQRIVPHPDAKPPVLPPPTPTNPDNPGFGGTGAGARDAQMFMMLNSILSDLAKIKAVVVKS